MSFLNKETAKEYRRRYYLKNKDKIHNNVLRLLKLPWYKTYHYITSRTLHPIGNYKKLGIKNFLNIADIKHLWFRDKAYLLKSPSIDRIDSTQHYTLENCRYIERSENIRRGSVDRWNKYRKERKVLQTKTNE